MEVRASFISGWANALSAARFTVGKDTKENMEPSEKWKMDMCASEHSPLREVLYRIEIHNAPKRAIMHLVRHHEGMEKFVTTSRPDRNPDAPQDTYDAMFTINAQALINISKERLCLHCWCETLNVWKEILSAVEKIDPVIVRFCVRKCIYRGVCPEMDCCGYVDTVDYDTKRHKYVAMFLKQNKK